MAGEAQDNVWPLPSFYFKVELGSLGEIAFKEVSGLDMEAQVIEYRHGNSPVFSNIKMPGLKKTSNVSLKKGVFKADNKLFDWFNKIKMNTIQREDVTISLLDEAGSPTMVWKLSNAWPTKVTGVSLKSDGNEAAIETLDLAHEGLTIENSFSYQVPTRRKHGNLVLKRSLMPLPHVLETYVVKVLENNGSAQIVPVNLTISLLDAGHFPLNNWSVLNAYPVKWDISALNSQKNELVIETLEMAYTNLIRMSIRDTEDTKKEQFKQWL